MMPGIWTSLQGGTLWHIMDGLDILNDKPRKSLVNQTYDTDDNLIETVGVQYDTGKGILWLDNYSLTNISQDVKNGSYRNFTEESILSKG